MKAIKLSAYEPLIFKKGIAMREVEMKGLIGWVKEILLIAVVTNWLGNFLALATVITFSVVSLYTASADQGVTTAKIFAVVSTITIISSPLLMLGQQIGGLLSAWASFKRIERFLLEAERAEQDEWTETSDSKDIAQPHHVKMDRATFGILESGFPILKDLSFAIENPKLWMIIGRVGSVSDIRAS